MITFGIITLFPEILGSLHYGVTGRAIAKQLAKLMYWNPRDFTNDVHRTIDDRPYGGGPGMVMKAEPLRQAIQAAKKALPFAKTIYLSPQGQPFCHQMAKKWASQPQPLIFIAGRYEGIDERIITHDIDHEWSIGDYILSGGELAAAVIIDALIRLLPTTLSNSQSAKQESFSDGLLDYPHYTRPENIDNQQVPKVLLQGNHQAIATWRLQQMLGRTWLKRPALLKKQKLNKHQLALLASFIKKRHANNTH